MNIYTVTFIHKNYGSLLQAYALQACLTSFGASPYIVLKNNSTTHSKFRQLLSVLLSDIIYLSRPNKDYNFSKRLQFKIDDLKFKAKYKKLDNFTKRNLSIIFIGDEKEFINSIDKTGIFLAGSDQVWNSTSRLPWYAFQWVNNNYPKYSYAASIGLSSLSNDEFNIYIDSLSSFNTISFREEQTFNLFRTKFPDKARQDLDPTLLCDKTFWRKIESPRLISEPYIFVYRLRPNEDVFDLARKAAKEKQCKIVYTGSYAYRAPDVQTIFDAGVEDFLSLVDYAEAVITNSFHGTAFSIIYEKPFLSAKVATTGSRAESLLSLLDLKSQYVDDINKDYTLNVDYTKVNACLENERKKSLGYLKTICSNK